MAIINKNNPIMKIKFLSVGKVLILDTNTIIRVFNDPRDIVDTRIGDLYIYLK